MTAQYDVETSDLERCASIFNALSEPLRIDMVAQIARADELACTVLDRTLPVSKSTISYHVRVLYHAGLISVRKEGRYFHYRLRKDVFTQYVPGFLPRLLRGKAAAPRRARRSTHGLDGRRKLSKFSNGQVGRVT
jgi:ArsR family transcriptional regulator, arsenate/arsenite/antimonite-responsive transcriptional repressor